MERTRPPAAHEDEAAPEETEEVDFPGARLQDPLERPWPAVTAYVALGSNLGDRRATLAEAVRRLGAVPGVRVEALSPVYEAAAHTLPGQTPQPAFLNAVAALTTRLDPLALLQAMFNVERSLGRDREAGGRWAARPIDLDLALFGERMVGEPGLEVPHPRLPERRFVLAPLADLAPDLVVPGAGATVGELLARCTDDAPLARTDLRLA